MQIWQKFKFGVFDVDSTIFDNLALSANVFFETVSEFKLPEEAREIYLETNGMNLDDQYKLVFDKYKVRYDDSVIKDLHDKFFDLRDNSDKWKKSPLFSGFKELLEKLRGNGVKNFVSSGSNTEDVASRLKNAGILQCFSLVLGAEKIPKGAGHIEKFAEYCKISPDEFSRQTFLLSDGAHDMALAKKSDIFAIGVTNTLDTEKLRSAGADMVIDDAGELINQEF